MPLTRTRHKRGGQKAGRASAVAKGTNPALVPLEVLVGDWEMQLSNTSFLPSPSDTAEGAVSIAWLEDGAFLLMRMGEKSLRPSQAIWLIGRDESMPEYRVLYYDSRRVSRIYNMSFSEGVWKMWRESPGFSQRYEGRVSKDGNTITARWEKSTDGVHWEHDFDVAYRRVLKTYARSRSRRA